MTLSLVIGLGIAAFIFLYFAVNLPEEHFLLRLLTYFFVFALILFIPKALIDIDNKEVCENVINSTLVTGNLTEHTYREICKTPGTTHTTKTIFLKNILWFTRLFWIYILVYINWWFWAKRMITESKTWKKARKLKGNTIEKGKGW